MSLTKHASFVVLAARIAQAGEPLMRTAHRATFDYTPKIGFLYVRSRAISSRCNDNFDEFPAEEIKTAYQTFVGKPVFVNHHNANHRRARGVIIDAALHEDVNPDGTPDTWVEVLMEVDAVHFPRLAEAIVKGDIERTSMGTDVAYSVCSACGNKASSPLEYCQHIPKMKGKRIYRTTASGAKEGILVREICYGLGFFENSLLVEDPADPTAYFLGVDTRGLEMAGARTASRTALRWTMAPEGLLCVDCNANAEDVPASYVLDNGDAVCDSHLEIRTEDEQDRLYRPEWYGIKPESAKDDTVPASSTSDPSRYDGVTISQDDKGYYVHTHRARSDSYPSPEEIPDSKIKFIESTGARKVASKTAITFDDGGRTTAPSQVDTLREEQCPVCGETDSYDGEKCPVCGFVTPPSEFGDPDLGKAKDVDLRQDQAEAQGDRLRCDGCGATFAGGVKVAIVLDRSKSEQDLQGDDTQVSAGDSCPECGKGTLQAVGPEGAPSEVEEAGPKQEGLLPEIAAQVGEQSREDVDGDEDADAEDDETSPPEDDPDEDEDDGKPDFLKKKKPTAARRGSSTRRSTVEMARPALAALAEQQTQINAIAEAITFLANAAGVGAHPKIASLRKRAEDENPAQPSGWANPGGNGTEAPAATTQEAATPAATDDPTDQGASPLTDVTPAATTSVESTETVLDEPLDLNEQDPTKPVAGTEDLGEGGRGQEGTNRTETDVRIGDPNQGGAAFQDGGFLSGTASLGERPIAALRLARLQIQAGIASGDIAAGDDLTLSQSIASSQQSDEAIAVEIATIAKVLAARPAQASPERRQVARNLVPQARTAGRTAPSLAESPFVPTMQVSAAVSPDEALFE